MRFAGEIVYGQGLKSSQLFLCLSRIVKALAQSRIKQGNPHQEGFAISPAFEIRHKAIDNMWLWGNEVDGIHVGVHFPPLLDSLDICLLSDRTVAPGGDSILAIFSLRISSSLTTLSMIFFAASSRTRTFHCEIVRAARGIEIADSHLLE